MWHRLDKLQRLALICFIIAIILFCYDKIPSHLVANYHPRITRQSMKNNKNKHVSFNMSRTQSATPSKMLKARAHAKNVQIMGQMIVPSVGLHLPIDQGVGNDALLLGAGTMKQNMPMGKSNYALAGHHMINESALFTPLWYHGNVGTKVYITDMKKVYIYQINQRKIISPYNLSVINGTNKPTLTLITCNDSGSKRLLLRGKLIKQQPLHQLSKPLRSDLNSQTNNHQVLKGY